MAKRGPKPTPTPVLKMRGSWRAKGRKEKINTNKLPAMPKFLTGYARAEWRRILPIFKKMGVLAEIDRTALMCYCVAFDEFRQAHELVKTLLVKTSNGNIIQHPAVSIRTNAWKKLVKIAAEFGMTPSSRTGMMVPAKAEDDNKKARFFSSAKGG